MAAVSFDPGKIIAQQHCFGLPAAGANWDGWAPELTDRLKSISGGKDLVLKPTYHFFDWKKQYADLTPFEANLRQRAKDVKNAMGFVEIVGKLHNAESSIERVLTDPAATKFDTYTAAKDVVSIVSPVCDATEFWHSQMEALPLETMQGVAHANALALLIFMATEVRDAIAKIDNAQSQTDVAIGLLELAKAVSYVALAAIALTSAFIVTIANAGFLILICSTSALAFSIIGEFAKRAYL